MQQQGTCIQLVTRTDASIKTSFSLNRGPYFPCPSPTIPVASGYPRALRVKYGRPGCIILFIHTYACMYVYMYDYLGHMYVCMYVCMHDYT